MSDAKYAWDWVDEGGGSYVVRKPDGSILRRTGRYKKGYEEAQAIAAAMNAGTQTGRDHA